MSYALTLYELQVMECVRDAGQPWDLFASVAATIACVNELVDRGFLEERGCSYRLTDLGGAVLHTHIAMLGRSIPE